ncbi:MAG: GNAT family N-acetyltransferase [Thermoleophilia bacterium]|nr:GNAT family N-acetyltransferase [Thermoleophilia bacterium]
MARLAVDLRHQGLGLGRALVRDMMLRAPLEQRRRVGCLGILVAALANRVSFYEQLGFVALDTVSGGPTSRTRYRAMFLSIGKIKRAAEV